LKVGEMLSAMKASNVVIVELISPAILELLLGLFQKLSAGLLGNIYTRKIDMASKQTPAKQQYDKAYNARPAEVKKRTERNAARAGYEARNGALPASVDVDHTKPLRKGGSNDPGNLAAKPATVNRGWRGGKKGYD